MSDKDVNPANQTTGDTNPLGGAGTGQQQRGMSGGLAGMTSLVADKVHIGEAANPTVKQTPGDTNPLGGAGTGQQQHGMAGLAGDTTRDFNPADQPIGDTNPLGGAGTGQQQRGMAAIATDLVDKAKDMLSGEKK